MKRFLVKVSKNKFEIHGLVQVIGNDILLSIWGGTRPHVGSVALAQPRPSLRNPRKWSSTSSDLTIIGHKEDIIAKRVSEKIASNLRRNVAVTAGFHWDNLTNREIKMIEKLSIKISDEVIKRISPLKSTEIIQPSYRRLKR